MNCEQKSGIFLNIKCSNTAKYDCNSCKKQVCKTHVHNYLGSDFCENCYWETYIYAKEQRVRDDYNHHNETTIIGFPTPTGSPGNNDTTPTQFEDGFGGGAFSGGGATGDWTEGDAQSFNDTTTDSNGGLLGGTDSTFFYS